MNLTDLLAQAADASPDADALVGVNDRFSWGQLERATAGVAAWLLESGITSGDRVGVACFKDTQSYIAAHGILRAGAVVVPVDPLAPPLAARDVLRDAEASGVIGDARTLRSMDPWATDGLELRIVVASGEEIDDRSTAWRDVVAHTSTQALPVVAPDHPAYIIYTSGSSGQPKGILHTHASAMAYAERAVVAHGLSPEDRVAGMNPLHFDMSTFELYAAPMARAAVVVMGEAHLRFPASFTARSEQEEVSVWYSVPSLFRQVVERGALDQRDLGPLRLIMYGGEPYSGGALASLMAALPHVQIRNVYGPAEVNECTNHTVTNTPGADAQVPIGRPWNGVELRVVDEMGGAVPRGSAGELWVSAPTVMTGYWNQPERSDASLHERPGTYPWYATGDIVVEDDDGVFWFNGRRDHQVKIRGVRLELEAIEAVLGDAPGVLHAVVGPVGQRGEATHVTAAVVLQDGVELELDDLRHWCVDRLPQVAVPREIVQRTDMPLTATGKIDRRQVRSELVASADNKNTVWERAPQ